MRAEGDRVASCSRDAGRAGLRGEELLERVNDLHPHAKRGLLIEFGAWGDEDTADAIRRAMALGHIDYYVLKPWSDPDELFHRTVSEFLHEWRRAHAAGRRELTVVADQYSARGFELRNLLARNGVPHAFHASDSEEGRRLLDVCGREGSTEPLVLLPDDSSSSTRRTRSSPRRATGSGRSSATTPRTVRRRGRRRRPRRAGGGRVRVLGGAATRSSSSGRRSAARRAPARASATTSASSAASPAGSSRRARTSRRGCSAPPSS